MRLIDKDALIDEIKHKLWDWDSVDGIMSSTVLKQTISDINNMPTIEAEPVRHGKWIKVGCSHFGVSTYECAVCHYGDEHNESREVPYCWHCGAKMDEVEE